MSVQVMVNGIPGNMGRIVAEIVLLAVWNLSRIL